MAARLVVTGEEHALLVEVGDFLGGLRRCDLARLCAFKSRVADAAPLTKEEFRAERNARKRDSTEATSARIAGSINRANDDEWSLAWRNLKSHRATLKAQIRALSKRVALAAGESDGEARGYRTEAERAQKRRRLQSRKSELRRVEARIAERRVSICVGGKDMARRRHILGAAQMGRADWEAEWRASRMFLSFCGESGKLHGNDTLRVDPETGQVELNLPAALAHRANVPGRRIYRFASPVSFASDHPSFSAWHDRAAARRSVAYRLRYDPSARRGNGAWYLTASWAEQPPPMPDLGSLRSKPTLGIDVNAGWIAAVAVDPSGNPLGRPISIPIPQQGSSARRLGQLRAAITLLGDLATEHGCASVSMENLDFADARATGRETMGSGRHGKARRRETSNIPTGIIAAAVPVMLARREIAVIAVDPACTSKWAAEHKWRETINCSEDHRCSTHHGAALVIGRRGLGLSARRSTGKRSIARCSCTSRQAESKTRTTGAPGRGCPKRPQRTRPQPRQRHKTGNAQQGTGGQRNATPFGVAQRSPPSTASNTAGRRDNRPPQ